MGREKVVAIAGNPNVGKSTVFNSLTNLRQHTGNWPGKTVVNATGYCNTKAYSYKMVDIPGTYSLLAHSQEEEVARDFICFGDADAVVVVCDATCLERNLNLVLQTMEITDKVIVCVNLLDEAKKKGIHVSLDALAKELKVPVIGMVARDGKGIDELLNTLDDMMCESESCKDRASLDCGESSVYQIMYSKVLEQAIHILEPAVEEVLQDNQEKEVADSVRVEEDNHFNQNKNLHRNECKLNARWLALKLLDYNEALDEGIRTYFHQNICTKPTIAEALIKATQILTEHGLDKKHIEEEIVSSVMLTAEKITGLSVKYEQERADLKDRKIDRILTGKRLGYPIMALLLMLILWLTIVGANYPSQLLSEALFWIQDQLTIFFEYIGAPSWLHGMLVLGVYRVLAWVISVMLPPMAIFFPMFTLLEDVGYLPRIAYNLDKPLKKCCACGKQALTMCMECVNLQCYFNVISTSSSLIIILSIRFARQARFS